MKKLRKRSQMLIYAISGFGVNMLNLMMNTYLCSALIAEGFDKEAIANQTFHGVNLVIPAAWMVISFLSKIVDGVIDIPMASFTDRLKTRWGRRRPAIVMGLVPMILCYVLFLIAPNPTGETMLNTIWYGVILCLFYSFYTLTMVTYYATFTEIVDNEADRDFISNVKSVCDIIYFTLGFVLVPAFLRGLPIATVALIVLPVVLTMLIPLFLIRESRNEIGVSGQGETVSLVRSLGHTLRNRDFVIWMIVYALMTFGVQLFLGGINEYFSVVKMNMTIVMGCSFAPVPFTLILYNRLMRKKGFGYAFRYVLLTYSLGMVAMFAAGAVTDNTVRTVLAIVCGLICSFAIGALFAVAYSVPAQLAAEEEERTGISNSAMYFAVQGLFSGVASGLSGVALTALKTSDALSALTLSLFDLESGVFWMTLVAGLGTLAAFAFTFILPKGIVLMGKTADAEKTQ